MKRSHLSPRTIVGCHGCSRSVADTILTEGRFHASENEYDWLGYGVYFWEYAPYRALDWARLVCLRYGGEPAVIAATIRLGECINLTDIEAHESLVRTHDYLIERYGEANLPKNTARGGHYRDRLVIDTHCDLIALLGISIDTVRGTFPEGEPIYPGSKILSRAHTQVSVRNPDCITRIELVRF